MKVPLLLVYSKKQREERPVSLYKMVYNCNVSPALHAVVDRKKPRILASSIGIAPLWNWSNIYLKNTPVNRHSLYFHTIPPLLLHLCNLITVLLVNREPQETMLLCWSVACSGTSHCRHIPQSSVNLNYTYGHQNWCELAEYNQIYKHAKLEGLLHHFLRLGQHYCQIASFIINTRVWSCACTENQNISDIQKNATSSYSLFNLWPWNLLTVTKSSLNRKARKRSTIHRVREKEKKNATLKFWIV